MNILPNSPKPFHVRPHKLQTFSLISTNRVTVSELGPLEIKTKPTYQEKHKTVLTELKISELKISSENQQRLNKIVSDNLRAFAGSDDDLCHTTVFEHKINRGDKPPFRERLRNFA